MNEKAKLVELVGCLLSAESFKGETKDGPYLNNDWKCRKCNLLPAEHPPLPSTGTQGK